MMELRFNELSVVLRDNWRRKLNLKAEKTFSELFFVSLIWCHKKPFAILFNQQKFCRFHRNIVDRKCIFISPSVLLARVES